MTTPYFEDGHIKIYNKSCFSMSELKDNSIQCCVTSPPYWGLRKYKAPDLIFGGNNHHEHDWITESKSLEYVQGNPEFARPHRENKSFNAVTNTCSICGAWKGQYGLEPTIDGYVQHTIEWLQVVKRVLRNDGVCFVNLGDSYSGSGGAHKPSHANPGISKSAERDGVPHLYDSNGDEIELLPQTDCDPLDSWAAGFFDGEGNIAIVKNNGLPAGKLRITAAQVDKQPILRLQQLFGGAIRQASSKRENWRSFWVWDLSADKAVSALKRMEPYLLVKKQQALLAYEFQETIGDLHRKPRLTPEVIANRERIKAEISALSHTVNYEEQPPLESKQLCLIPFRVALAAQSDGWWIRSIIIWNKPNPMPESVKDRPTDAYEYILMLTKNSRYCWDIEAVREPVLPQSLERAEYAWTQKNYDPMAAITGIDTDRMGERFVNPNGRNLRNVWTFPTQPYPKAHFATFPEELPERCIKAASKENDLILDPFCGSGTTLWVAKRLNRKAVGYEISPEYCELALDRNRQGVMV